MSALPPFLTSLSILKPVNVACLLVVVTVILLSCFRSRDILMAGELDQELTPGTAAERIELFRN
jgi:hypothetical protein